MLSCPTVLIWSPDRKNTFGHVALLTNLFYISLWPFDRKNFAQISKLSVVGCLHFDEKEDIKKEGYRQPNRYEIVNVTNEQINCQYVKFLECNGINPEEVSLAAAEKKTDECRRELTRTRYSFVGNVIVEKRKERSYSDLLFCIKRCLTPGWGNNTFCFDCKNRSERVECLFYHKPQSCVSFCFNLIEMADPKPLVCLVEARKKTRTISFAGLLYSFLGMCLEISVPNFEKHVVKKYWLKDCKREHYNVLDFQKRTRFLMLSENLFKKILTSFPTVVALQLVNDRIDPIFQCWSYPLLFGLTWSIHSINFVLLYVVLVRLFPTIHVPKPMAVIGGVMILIILFVLFQFIYHSPSVNLMTIDIPIVNISCFFIFVLVSEFVMRECLDRFEFCGLNDDYV